MKLLVQSDDYGITRAAALGCVHGITHGVVRNTGFFTNMPWAKECLEWIRPHLDDIAFGIDLNGSTGPSILGHAALPTLTHEDGTLLGSRENRALDTAENGYDHLAEAADQLKAEFRAQIERYIELVGRKPDYIHNHAYGTATTLRVTLELAREYDVISWLAVNARPEVAKVGGSWYVPGGPEAQLGEDPLADITADPSVLASDWGLTICHCGYLDADLFRLTSYTTCRAMDLAAMCSDELRSWIAGNNIELVTYKDLPAEWRTDVNQDAVLRAAASALA